MQYIWKLVNVWVGAEATRWQPASSFDFLPRISFDYEDKIELEKNQQAIWKLADTIDTCIWKQYGEGSLEWNLGVNAVWYFFKNLLGDVSSVETADNSWAYKHTFSLAHNNLHSSLTIAVVEPNNNVVFPLAMVEELTINAEPGKCLSYKASFKSKSSQTASNTASYLEDYVLNSSSLVVKIADAEEGLDTGVALDLLNFELKVSQNLEEIYQIWALEPSEIFNWIVKIEGSFEMVYNSNDLKNIFTSQQKKALGIYIKDLSKTIGSNQDNPQLNIVLPKVILTDWAHNIDNENIVQQTMGFEALYDVANDKLISVELVNTKASY